MKEIRSIAVQPTKCVKEFISPTRRQASLREWGTLLGEPLGEIGVCGIDMQNQLK